MPAKPPMDKSGPWTIKSVPRATRDKITDAAFREGLTVGQWIEKRVDEWIADGRPIVVPPAGPPDLAKLASLIEAVRLLAHDSGVEVPERLVRSSFSQLRRAFREDRLLLTHG